MRSFWKKRGSKHGSECENHTNENTEDEDEFHDSAEAMLHPEAHEEGGYGFTNKELLAQQRGVVTEIIKEMGKKLLSGHLNLINVSLPVKIFEPRSYLEKLTDNWVHPHFLLEAAHTTDPISRLELVITWFVAGLQHSFQSWRKPFNPILGETFQATLSDGSTVAMEQISHHPPVSAFQLKAPDGSYEFSGVSQPDVSFELKANSVRTQAKGKRRLIFSDGTKIEIEYPVYYMRGLLYTAMPRGDVTGSSTFSDRKNNLVGEVHFGRVPGNEHEAILQRSDAISVNIHEVTWPLNDAEPLDSRNNSLDGGVKKRSISGIAGGISSILHRGESGSGSSVPHVTYTKGKLCSSGQGNWLAYLDWNGSRQWTLMNDKPAHWIKLENVLPSDSRYRKDLQALLEGDYQKAQAAKEELEQKQRQEAKLRKPAVEATTHLFGRSISLGR